MRSMSYSMTFVCAHTCDVWVCSCVACLTGYESNCVTSGLYTTLCGLAVCCICKLLQMLLLDMVNVYCHYYSTTHYKMSTADGKHWWCDRVKREKEANWLCGQTTKHTSRKANVHLQYILRSVLIDVRQSQNWVVKQTTQRYENLCFHVNMQVQYYCNVYTVSSSILIVIYIIMQPMNNLMVSITTWVPTTTV